MRETLGTRWNRLGRDWYSSVARPLRYTSKSTRVEKSVETVPKSVLPFRSNLPDLIEDVVDARKIPFTGSDCGTSCLLNGSIWEERLRCFSTLHCIRNNKILWQNLVKQSHYYSLGIVSDSRPLFSSTTVDLPLNLL